VDKGRCVGVVDSETLLGVVAGTERTAPPGTEQPKEAV
jgi:glycine betaine/proline transport system ATP-binding protein